MKTSFLLILLPAIAWGNICDRTPQVYQVISKILKKDCGEVRKEDLAGMTTLALVSLGITNLKKGDFEGFSSLSTLYLGGNQITSIEKGSFKGLFSLSSLYLDVSQITSITRVSFEGLSSLSYLDLGHNLISSIKKGSFEGLSSLTYLNLNSNQITSIEKGSFKGLASLSSLDLSDNPISSIEKESFEGLSSLIYLNLRSNQITSIEEGGFKGLSSLSYLFLDGNQITFIEKGDFEGLPSLSYLNLGHNQISSIERDGFEGLSFFNDLNLEDNKLTSIEEGSFSSYFCYRGKLTLRYNPLPPEAISYYESLRGVKVLNPYQCLLGKSNLKWEDLGAENFHLLVMLLNQKARITQVEVVVPLLEGALARDFKKLPIFSHYGYGLIPSLDGSVDGIHYVRELAVEVCRMAHEFCPVREEIHAFPTKEHLKATTALKEKLIKANAPSEHIAKTEKLERALEQMFSMSLNYKDLRAKLPTGELLNEIDGLFNRNTWDLVEIGEAFNLIQEELLSQSDQWSKEYFHPLFKVKGYLLHQFKTIFWQGRNNYTKEELFEALLLMSEGNSLLRQREASYLRSAVQRGGDLKVLTKKAIDWQLKNMEREHFPQVNNSKYSPINPKFEDPQKKLQEVFEKMIRTSVITEWDELKEDLP